MQIIENGLVPIYQNENKEKLVSARELHVFLESKRQFADWIKQRIEKYGFIEDIDYISFSQICENGGKSNEYVLTLDTAKELSMVENNDKGKLARKYFIESEKKLKQLITPQLSVLDTLKLAVSQLEEKEIIIKEKNKEISIMKPNHDFVETVFVRAETNIKIGELAQVLAMKRPNEPNKLIGQNTLYKYLKEMKILKASKMPYQQYLDLGYFVVAENHIDKTNKLSFTTLVTPRGQTWVRKKLTQYVEFEESKRPRFVLID